MKLLHVTANVDPTGGGPMEGILQSSLALIEMGHQVEVATLEDPKAPYLVDYPLTVHALGPSYTKYGYAPRFLGWLRAHARDYDAVIVNGLWMYHCYATWKALRGTGVPYFVFPHGMLDPWFKKTYPLKHLRKLLVWPWAEYRLLRDARRVLFTCEEERLVARKSFRMYRVCEAVVAFGTRRPPVNADILREEFFSKYPELRGKRLLLFLSRIHRKKGCDLLIKAFARVANDAPGLHLVLAGPDHTGLQPKLMSQANTMGVSDRISWPGMLSGATKWGAFYACEVYLLSSHQENFGIAVAEALGCGVPVLISNKVNIWREIDDAKAGIVEQDTVEGCEKGLRRWLEMPSDMREQMSLSAAQLFTDRFAIAAAAESLIEIVTTANSRAA